MFHCKAIALGINQLTAAGGVSNGLCSTLKSIKVFISLRFNGKRAIRLNEQSKLINFKAHNSKEKGSFGVKRDHREEKFKVEPMKLSFLMI